MDVFIKFNISEERRAIRWNSPTIRADELINEICVIKNIREEDYVICLKHEFNRTEYIDFDDIPEKTCLLISITPRNQPIRDEKLEHRHQPSSEPTSEDLMMAQLTTELDDTLRIGNPPPLALLCSLCENFLTEPIAMDCCASSFCDECITSTIAKSGCNNAVCPECGKKMGYNSYQSNSALKEIGKRWLFRSGSSEWKSKAKKRTYIEPVVNENCPPSSLCCPICTNMMTECRIMFCCGTTFCSLCITKMNSSWEDPVCPGAGCDCKNVGMGNHDPNFVLQHAARSWLSEWELSNKTTQNHKTSSTSTTSSPLAFESLEMVRLTETSNTPGSDKRFLTTSDFTSPMNTMVPDVMSLIPSDTDNITSDFNKSAITAQTTGTYHADGTLVYPMSDDSNLILATSTTPKAKSQHQTTSLDLTPTKTSKTNSSRRSAFTVSQSFNKSSNARESVSSKMSYSREFYSPYQRSRRNRCEYERGRENGRQLFDRMKEEKSGKDISRKMKSTDRAKYARDVKCEDVEATRDDLHNVEFVNYDPSPME